MTDPNWIIDRVGQPIPCELCRTLTMAVELRELVVPATVLQEWDIVVHRIVFVCGRCPG
jgi:hypothetical protein